MALPGITAAVVTLNEDLNGARRLTAYLVASSEATSMTETVRATLKRQLPRNMVPTYFVWLDALPLTPNGKLDRKALPQPKHEKIRPAANLPPKTRLEREIAEIWEDLLQVSQIGVRSDFFNLGGDSLALVSLLAAIDARFGRQLTVDILSGGLTIARLAQILGNEPPQVQIDPVVALQPLGNLPPFFCAHGIGGDVLHLHRLAVNMGTDRPFFGLRRTSEACLSDTIPELARRYVNAILVHQPVGPFYLGGASFGAMIAYEMARQLLEQGHEIGLLAIIDQRHPGWRLTVRDTILTLPQILASIPHRIRDELVQVPAAKRLRAMRRLLLRWSKTALGLRPGVSLMFDFSLAKPEQIILFESHIHALRNYRPAPLPVTITLFRADKQLLSHLALDRSLGWSKVTKREVQVRTVPGTHESIMAEPLVRQLAQTLSAELDAAQGVTYAARNS
jgi:thioesterase domain-containing protein